MVRLSFIIGLIALIGVTLSGLAAHRVHQQELTIDGIALARAIDVHASLVQDRLTERELLARVASYLFRSPSVVKANMLEPLRSSIYAFKADFVVAGWIARLKPNELDAARNELARAGFHDPSIRDIDGKALDPHSPQQPVDVLMDVEPRNDQTAPFVGRVLDDSPVLGAVLARVMEKVVRLASSVAKDSQNLAGLRCHKTEKRCRRNARSRIITQNECCHFREENGGSDGARTRDLRRDRPTL